MNTLDANMTDPFYPANQTLAPSTSPAPVVSMDDIWPWRNGLFGVGGTCIACVGVVCNCTAIVVLAHYRNKSSAPFLLICLEIFDTIFLISEMFLENLVYVAQGGMIDDSYRTFITPIYCYAHPIPNVLRTCSAYSVVVITLERYAVVAWPLAAHRICRPKKARLAVLVVIVMSIVFHIPRYMAWTCTEVWSNRTQSEKLRFHRTDFGEGDFYNRVHVIWLNLCVSFLVPFLVLLSFNALMLVALWRAHRARSVSEDNQRRTKREQKLTIMVVCMTAIFFLCELFPAIALILVSGLNVFTQCSKECNEFTAVADTMTLVNASINFAIYCASAKKFRDVFKQLFLRRPGRQRSIGGSTSVSRSSGFGAKLALAFGRRRGRHAQSNGEVATCPSDGSSTVTFHLRRTLLTDTS